MGLYLQACGAVLLALVLILCVANRTKEIAVLLGIGVCCMVMLVAMRYIEPVVDFVKQLSSIGDLDASMIAILLKVVGIGMVSEVASLVCADSGNSSLGKTLQLLGNAVMLYLAIPLFTMLMELVQTILGEL